MTQSPTDKLIQDGLWRDISEAPEYEDILTISKHGLIQGQYDPEDTRVRAYYWQYMSWWSDKWRPLPDDRLANALKVAVEALDCIAESANPSQWHTIERALTEIENIAKGEER